MKSVPNQLNANWACVDWVLTDVDDTLTWQGKLPPETLIALNDLQQAGITVIAVTGACAGWCDHIAQLWPVDAVLGENGAFIMEKQSSYLTLQADDGLETLKERQTRLKSQVLEILKDYPELSLTLDQSYRLCEVSIDIGQNRPKLDSGITDDIIAKIHALGAHATASSIHINAWYGQHSKKQTSMAFLKDKGLSEKEIFSRCCYVGDSLNDQQMFATLPKSAGVQNINHYWDKLSAKPSVVIDRPGGYGFAEFTRQLLALKSTT
ncbi:HAD-IIB family hydrolase [Vibrio genomosp. F10 str. 9ZC157]|uniref:Hydrolase n=1 Tax=Vibrio genomosp. F10 str. ZF-129 TaxID=1187848 RepID=A0A1E5BGA7_9VIBR|nr:HAD-IIB family hydrolase [Vibrio genomosp. F10]OEE34473.1 hydrolase [Vibrio genomosp. F10 str. ZF-129]OEE98599.1 hydrolase [Vibrio genomosp. F10 str. 9ZC157]